MQSRDGRQARLRESTGHIDLRCNRFRLWVGQSESRSTGSGHFALCDETLSDPSVPFRGRALGAARCDSLKERLRCHHAAPRRSSSARQAVSRTDSAGRQLA